MSGLRKYAIGYAGDGLEIFPVDPDTKEPMAVTVRGAPSQHKATTDLDQIDAWWQQWPEALIGHRIAPHVVLLDIDPRHGGLGTWKALRAELGMNGLVTRTHRSGRGDGGGHTWWQRPEGKLSTAKLNEWAREHGLGQELDGGRWSAGIDLLQHDHRYTILPPSPHPDTHKPYRWAKGRGLATEPAPMPALLAELITGEDRPDPARNGGSGRDGFVKVGPASWLAANRSWPEILERHGWVLVPGDGDGDEDGSAWRHPEATNSKSATIRGGRLYVHSTSTPFEPTAPDDPHGYDKLDAIAVLEHHGDTSEAGRAVRAMMPAADPSGDGAGPSGGAHPAVADRLPDDFWTTSPVLTHIYRAALAKRVNPTALLVTVLSRASSYVPHTLTVGGQTGNALPLGTFVALYATTGGGKSRTIAAARKLLPAPEWVTLHEVPLGSGEGLAEMLFEQVTEVDPDTGNKVKPRRQTRHNAWVVRPEGQELLAQSRRQGTTVLPALRAAWSGEVLGQMNAKEETRRPVPAGSYTIGLVLGFQPSTIGGLLADDVAGTPGRFVWALTSDPDAPAERGEWPGPLEWEPPPGIDAGWDIPLAPEVAAEVEAEDLAQLRGELVLSPIEAQGRALRLKLAGMLAVLEGRWRTGVTVEDGERTGKLATTSEAVRQRAIADVATQTARGRQHRLDERKHEAVEIDAAKERRRVVDGARRIAAKVHAEPERWTVLDLRRDLRRWRDVYDDALGHAAAEGWVTEVEEPSHTDQPRRWLRPGEVRP